MYGLLAALDIFTKGADRAGEDDVESAGRLIGGKQDLSLPNPALDGVRRKFATASSGRSRNKADFARMLTRRSRDMAIPSCGIRLRMATTVVIKVTEPLLIWLYVESCKEIHHGHYSGNTRPRHCC
jgi:hypothetical protein